MKFNLSNIKLSKNDINRQIKFPKKLDEKLAEFIGIMLGDGHLRLLNAVNKKGYKSTKSDMIISGNKKEIEYHGYITKLFDSLFNLKLFYRRDKRSNAILLLAHSKGIVQYLNLICEIPLNRKTTIIKIPEIIKNANKSIKAAFLKGLADTDFTVTFQNKTNKGHNYPVIKGSFRSKKLIEDLEVVFNELNFCCSTFYNEKRHDYRTNTFCFMHNIYLYGRDNLNKWIKDVGFSNPKFNRKITKWKTDGICPPGYC